MPKITHKHGALDQQLCVPVRKYWRQTYGNNGLKLKLLHNALPIGSSPSESALERIYLTGFATHFFHHFLHLENYSPVPSSRRGLSSPRRDRDHRLETWRWQKRGAVEVAPVTSREQCSSSCLGPCGPVSLALGLVKPCAVFVWEILGGWYLTTCHGRLRKDSIDLKINRTCSLAEFGLPR